MEHFLTTKESYFYSFSTHLSEPSSSNNIGSSLVVLRTNSYRSLEKITGL